jgi:argininosuccinate synthase
MNFTITTMQEMASGQTIDFLKDGNKYSIYFTDGEKAYSKKFETIDEAHRVFQTISNYFIHGVYTFEQRAETLNK